MSVLRSNIFNHRSSPLPSLTSPVIHIFSICNPEICLANSSNITSVKSVKYVETLPTAKVLFKNGVELDFASTRKECYKKQGDLPVVTEIGCPLKDDVLRRDFTVNAIAISLNRNNLFEIVDYLGGQEDLSKKQLRILHKKSFYDDPSRIIRGLKFAVRLGFILEEETKILQEEYLENPLKNIPLERVKSEIKELFSLNKLAAFDDFLTQKIYKIFVDNSIMLSHSLLFVCKYIILCLYIRLL